MVERIVAKPNMLKACRQVVSNKGAAGVDGLGVLALAQHLAVHGERLAAELRGGHYEPQAILGVAIPKSKGGTRLLGIPTVVDRLLQQAVHQVIMPLFEMEPACRQAGSRLTATASAPNGAPNRRFSAHNRTSMRGISTSLIST